MNEIKVWDLGLKAEGGDALLTCPVCGYDYVHLGIPKVIPDSSYLNGLGDVFVMPFYGECGHEWVLALGEYKGRIYYEVNIDFTKVKTEPQITFDSPIEQAFWEEWLSCCSGGIEIIPQYQIGKYRVDFAHPSTKTAIELDGHATHSSPDAIAKDRKRQRYLESQGWHVIRFGGKEVFQSAGTCVDEAWTIISKRINGEVPVS